MEAPALQENAAHEVAWCPVRTRLDELETSQPGVASAAPEDREADLLSISFRHSHWRHQRAATFEALCKSGQSPAAVHRFATCGSRAWVQQSQEPQPRYRIVTDRCRSRWCEACQREYRTKVALNLMEHAAGRHLRFLTLTLRSRPEPLGQQISRLYRCAARFRSNRQIRPLMKGGIAFLELTKSAKTGLWHPHLHILFEGSYLPKELAAAVWHKATGDSYIVDVRALRDPRTAAGYVTKYAGKVVPHSVTQDPDAFAEVIAAIGNLRTFNTFGTWRQWGLAKSTPSDVGWEYLGSLPAIMDAARRGDADALDIVKGLLSSAGMCADAHLYGEPAPPVPFS